MTPSQTVGPFFHLALTLDESFGHMASAGAEGEHVTLICRVLDGDGTPIDDAMIELWQADASGIYADHLPGFRGFGRLATNEQGICVFETIRPGRVANSNGRSDAPHINVSVFARGLLKRAVTRIYFSGDPANLEDPVLALTPADRRDTLMARQDAANLSVWTFDIHLCGDRETVFFQI